MFINYRDLAGIQQCHLGHSGGAGARADSQSLIPAGRGGVKPSHLCWKGQRVSQPCPHCPYWKQGWVFKRLWLSVAQDQQQQRWDVQNAQGTQKSLLPRLLPVPSHQRCLFLWGGWVQGMALDVWEVLKGPRSAEQHPLRDWGPLFNTL